MRHNLMDPTYEPSDRALAKLMRDTHEQAMAKREATLAAFRANLAEQIRQARASSKSGMKVVISAERLTNG